jgi:glycosyltransferase involved in cell wall biosynthesis
MRIVYLVESLQPAGAERVVMELARAEGSESCVAEIITLRETPASVGGQCPDIRPFPLFRQGEFHWPGSAPRAAWRLRRKLLQLRPDVLAIHTPKAAVVAALVGVKVPTLWVLHGHDVCWDGATARRRLSRALQRWTRKRLRARVAAVSASLAEHAAKGLGMAREEIVVVPNGIDTTRFRFEEKIPADDVVVCVLGRLVPWKGPWQAIEAFRWLKKRFPVARLWFVGDGPMRDELAAVVEALGWEHAVTFWGMLERPEERLRRVTVLWMPSEGEGFGIACVEAMATGTPVLGFDVRGVRDLLRQGCGVLVPPQDARELAVQTARLVSDESRYRAVARAARARVESGYSLERMRAGHMQLMQVLCGQNEAPCGGSLPETC